MRLVPIAAALASLVAAAPTAADNPQLVGNVGPGFTISVTSGGAQVTHLDPGTYTLLVHDQADVHNFHLFGPGVNVSTDVDFVGDQTFTITLVDGVYTFDCDAHPGSMKGAFAVGTAQLPTGPPTTTPSPRALSLRVAAGGHVTAPAHLAPGTYAVTVHDAGAADDLHLKGPGVDRKTGLAFKGTAHWTVTLKRGGYRAFSDAHASLARTIRVG